MKGILIILVYNFIAFGMNAQNIVGAWEAHTTSKAGDQLKTVVIFSDAYHVSATYNTTTEMFMESKGGSWTLDEDILTQTTEFDTEDSARVGTENRFKVEVSDTTMDNKDQNITLKRIVNGQPGALQGAWLMSGRVIDGNAQERDTSGPRKTMKMLSGTRFQWIAYNTETKQFMGTGGGTYTTRNGVYTENIEFFSRDVTRVGNSLKFDYELIDGHWHHRGLSSKGDTINEIWSMRP